MENGVGIVGDSKEESKDVDENEVFEEALEAESFFTPRMHERSDSLDVNGDKGVDKFDELIDGRVKEKNLVVAEGFQDSCDARDGSELFNGQTDGNGGSAGACDLELRDQSTDARAAVMTLVAVEAVAFEEETKPLEQMEGTSEVVQAYSNGIDADAVVQNGDEDTTGRFPGIVNERESNHEEIRKWAAEEICQNLKLDETNSGDAHAVSHLKIESTESVAVIYQEDAGHGGGSKEQIPDEDRDKNFSHPHGAVNLDSVIDANTSASLETEVRSIDSQIADRNRENQGQNGGEMERESVLVKETVVTRSAPSAASRSENLGGLSLPARPAGLGSSAPLLEPATRSHQQLRTNGSLFQRQPQPIEEPVTDEPEENRETREKLQMIRVKFLRLAHRLGQTPHNVVVAQVLYRLGLAEQLWGNTNRAGVFSYDRASVMAEQLEAGGQDLLDFSCTILVIGKSGVGKSATINSIFDEAKFQTDAFKLGTKKVQAIEGTVQGIKIRVIDTPGLSSSSSDQHCNEKILRSVKRFISKTRPDIVLYFDRLDMQSRDFGDVPLLRTITDVFGASIWFNAIVVLTHAASAPPDGPNGTPLSYEMFVTQRSHVVQQAIRQAAGDVRLMNPISLVENHSACRMNRAGQRVLPNGQVWKPQLLLLSFASKILAEANLLLKLQDSPPGRPFGSRPRVPPLPFLLSSLLQSRPQLKLPNEQLGDEDTVDEDLEGASDSGDESEDYDDLPPFKCLTKSQVEKLTRAQRKAYFEELEYRERLFFKKQLKEEKKRRKMMKKLAESMKDLPSDYNNENLEDEGGGPASVPVPMPDLALPASFDSDYPSHRYRFLDSSNQWLVRPVLETQGWDHDVGYEGLNAERLFVVKDKIPVSVSGQLTKDKKEFNLQMELGTSIKHSEGKATSVGLDVQTVGKDMAYTVRGETMFKNFRRNSTVAGLSVTHLGDATSAGVKIEDKLIVNKRFRLLMTGGAMTGRGDVAYGGRLEATLRDKDYPLGRAVSNVALSIVDWHGDLAIGCNVQSQIPLGRGTNLSGHANLSNKGSGQIGIRLNSSDHLEIALLAVLTIFQNVKKLLLDSLQST